MSFKRVNGKTKIVWRPLATSTACSVDSIVAWNGSGYLTAATSSTAPTAHVGVIRKAITSASPEYTTAGLVPVEVPVEKNVEWIGSVTSGLVAADRGLFQDLTDASTVNRGASTYDAVQCVEVISTTKGKFILNLGCEGMGVAGAA
jgi:hypothetical protein